MERSPLLLRRGQRGAGLLHSSLSPRFFDLFTPIIDREESIFHKTRTPPPFLRENLFLFFMMLTQKLRIFPSEAQAKVLWDLAEKCRLIYNFALAERFEKWRQNKEKRKDEQGYLSYTDQQNQLPHIKQRYPEYRWVYSKVLQVTLRKLDADIKSFVALRKKGDTNARPPRFKSKKYFTTLCYNQSGFKLSDSTLSLSHKHPSKEPLLFELRKEVIPRGTCKQVELFRDARKRWFISLTCEIEVPPYHDNALYHAFDLGVAQTTGVNLHGKSVQFRHKRADLYWKKKIEEVQSKRDHCKKYSRRWTHYHLKLKNMKYRLACQLKDYQHWLSKQLIENTKANTLIVGDLAVKGMARRKKSTGNARMTKAAKTLHHSVQNAGFMGRLAEFLTYKAEKVGKRVIRIGEERTTKACCKCGKLTHHPLYERFIECDCGNRIDRDVNAAINMMVKFLILKQCGQFAFLSPQPSVNEESFLTCDDWNGFLRHTGLLDLEAGAYS